MSEYFLDVYVHGDPKAQGSMKHIGKGRMIHEPDLVQWRDNIIETLEQWNGTYFGAREPVDLPVAVKAEFWLPRPARPRYDLPGTALDLDKLMRAVGDALEKSRVLTNDSRIVQWDNPRKHYAHGIAGDGEEPGARIKVREL